MSIRFTILSAPRTKKTHNLVVAHSGKIRVLPNPAWVRWCKGAQFVGSPEWDGNGVPVYHRTLWRLPALPLDTPFNWRALFYRVAKRGDAVGYYQGLADLLDMRGVVENDALIVSWDGSRLLKDAQHPRVEVELTEV